MIHKCIGDSTYPSIMLLINTKSYSCCTRPALERILMVKMTPSQNRYFQNSQLLFCENASFPIFSNHSDLIIAHLTGFRWARTPALESFCTLPRWSAQVTTGRVQGNASGVTLNAATISILGHFNSPFSHNCGWRTWETFGESFFWEPLFSDFYFRFGLGKSQAFFSIEKNDKRENDIILYVSRMKIRWVIEKGSR